MVKFRFFKKTVFKKLVFIIISLLILSFVVTGAFLYYFLNAFVTNEKLTTLEQSATDIKEAFNLYFENYDNAVVRTLFLSTLQSISGSTHSIVWIVDKSGHVILSSPSMPKYIASKYIDSTGYIKLPNTSQYKDVMEGNKTVIEQGDFYGFFEDSYFKSEGNSWLTLEVPFQIMPSNGKQETIAAVYLHTPVPEVQRVRYAVFRLFVLSGGVAIFIAIILVYIFSIRFTRPLKQINSAAKIIAGGEFTNRLVVKSDDEIGQLAKSFNQMVEDLQKLEEMRRGFIANVSHELRTPMTSIRGFVEGILDGTIPPEKHEYYLTIVRDETNRLNRLVNDLLDLAKREAGELTLNIRPININELIRICVIKQETLITSKDIDIEANFESEDMLVLGDSDCIERVIINLLHNAVKFSNQGGKIILETVKNKDKVFVSIQDNGIGIEESEQKRIWDRFYKTDKSRGKDKTGTGLGLAIVKSIINEHKQDIWVDSTPGMGTKFTFTLDFFKNDLED